MPGAARAEIIFIAGMMLLTLIFSGVAVYFFFKTYAREKRAREENKKRSQAEKANSEIV